jgi:hypothetical protein
MALKDGIWIFDTKSRDMIYLPNSTRYFQPGKDGRKWIRFHVVVSREAARLPSLQARPAEITGILFQPVEPYSWF